MLREIKRVVINGYACPVKRQAYLKIARIGLEEVKEWLKAGPILNAIGHLGAAEFFYQLTGDERVRGAPRPAIWYDELAPVEAVSIVLNFRPEEGKVYSKQEMEQLYSEGKVGFVLIRADCHSFPVSPDQQTSKQLW
ncbi:MAG: DUF1874 domain-containing protein [Candidatus Hadarchaeales archaeon]